MSVKPVFNDFSPYYFKEPFFLFRIFMGLVLRKEISNTTKKIQKQKS